MCVSPNTKPNITACTAATVILPFGKVTKIPGVKIKKSSTFNNSNFIIKYNLMNDVNVNECKKIIKSGMIVRYVLTILIIIYLGLSKNTFMKKYIYLIIPLLLEILDIVDNYLYARGYIKQTNTNYNCSKQFYYQINDKICDSSSYILTFLLLCLYFKPDFILLFFIVYRIIGVTLFYITKDSSWLILFFDFIKEYLLYLFIFNRNYSYILVCIFLKICFEFYFHKKVNNANYKLDK